MAISARSINQFARPSENGPWPVHARARQRTRPSTPRPSRARQRTPAPRPRGALSPAPRPQPGPGPGFRPSSSARLGQKRPEPSWPLISDRRWSAQLGASKTPADRASLSPSFIFTRTLSLFASLLSSSLLSSSPSDHGEAARSQRRHRPPRRRACSPAGERAAVERPGRGAPVAGSRRAVPPYGWPLFSLRAPACSTAR